MATRAEVLAAYAANPKATLVPTEDAIKFFMDGGLSNFNTIVDQVRAQNPTLAAQIDRDRAAAATNTGTVVTGGNVDNSARYRQLVLDAYANIGRKGIGTNPNQADQAGVNFWTNALTSGTLTPETFGASFNKDVSAYINQNPTDAVTQNVQAYRPFANTGLLSQQQLQPQSMGAQAVPTYQPQSLAQNFQNYMGIPIGAQYNPAVTAGGASPYSQIKALSPAMVNPYAGIVANTAMGGYNPMLYENVKAAARAAGSLAPTDYLIGNSDGAATSGAGGPAPAPGGGGDSGPVAGFAGETFNGGLITSVYGANPPGPDDGVRNLDLGEYVIKKSSVDKYGKGLLEMINEGKVPVKKAKSLLF
jgi:hypothetical protein